MSVNPNSCEDLDQNADINNKSKIDNFSAIVDIFDPLIFIYYLSAVLTCITTEFG